jgi:hypothetical protein
MISRVAAYALGLACVLAILFLVAFRARTDTPVDEVDPNLVTLYLGFPCEALADSYSFQYKEMIHLTERIQYCEEAKENSPDYKYGKLMCFYVQMQWDLMNRHSMAVDRARELMCEAGELKNPQYEIDF